MHTKTIQCYQFSELSEQAKEKARANECDINVDHNWWDSTKEDARETACLEIESFDSYRGDIAGKLTVDNIEDSIKSIIENHGRKCQTYKTAKEYQKQLQVVKVKNRLRPDADQFDNDMEELKEAYEKAMLKLYLKMLGEEYEYLTSNEAIDETLEANQYEFDIEGNRI